MLFVFSFVCMILVIVCKDKEKKITPSLRAARIGCFCKKKIHNCSELKFENKEKKSLTLRGPLINIYC